MRIVQINMVSSGSTGKIMLNIAKLVRAKGDNAQTFSARQFTWPRKNDYPEIDGHKYFGTYYENAIHNVLGQLTGLNGSYSVIGTAQLIREIKKFKPDIIHLHNLHSFCINFPMLFRYIKKHRISVVWTLHDCWTFTGHCPHFMLANCDKWKTKCQKCPQLLIYPKSRIDNTGLAYKLKKKWFTGIENMTLVTPSVWLGDLVKQSFLKEYPLRVINNGIDLSVFKPTESDSRKKYNIPEEKKILLGVSFGWGYRKGLDVFKELSARIDKDKYQIVLVGTNDYVDKELPDNIISIHRTNNQKELSEIYTTSDLFINPTREDTYPTVNMEALSCGTPVLTFKTGGSPEIIDATCGSIVEKDDINAMVNEIIRICNNTPYSKEACLKRATEFDMNDRFEEYIELYKEVLNK